MQHLFITFLRIREHEFDIQFQSNDSLFFSLRLSILIAYFNDVNSFDITLNNEGSKCDILQACSVDI